MPRLKSSKEIIKILEGKGFVFVSQKGSHGKYCNVKMKATVIIPINKREIPSGTLASVIRQSKLSRDIFQ
jgi:predicted RNA binding protein YcfA (HicA-like mRNA interferase family)